MSKHTPGPWEPGEIHSDGDRRQILRRDVCIAAALYTGDHDETDANARLISAAPDLLAALKMARDIIGHPDDEGSKIICAAIAKAEGDQS